MGGRVGARLLTGPAETPCWRGNGFRRESRVFGVLILLAFGLIGCSGQAIVPPVDISSTAGAHPIPGHYAATVQTGSWLLKTTTERAICGAWTFDTDLDASYEAAIRNALQRVLERVTFVPNVLTPQQIKARGFDAQIIIGQGGANSSFTVPVYTITGTAQGSVELSVTVSIRPAAGNPSQETVSARGHGRAEISRCSGAATAISASARNALGTVTRAIVRSVQQRLDVREANNQPQPKAPARSRTATSGDSTAATEEAEAQPRNDEPVDKQADQPVATARDASTPSDDREAPIASRPSDNRDSKIASLPPDNRDTQFASRPRADAPRSRVDPGPLTAEQAFQRGIDAVEGRGQNDSEAVRWFRIAADQGYAPAENNLGFMYAEGRGVVRDDKKAVEWYRRAAERGYPPAQTSLAMMVQAGRGAPRNDVQALALYSAAAGQGYAPATANVAQMVAEGRGIPRDENTAAFLLATAGEPPRSGSGIFVEGQ
jgi:TPR repeat protein